jgi:UDP-N-acetylglucosamine 1-carboxyvinyltransferase
VLHGEVSVSGSKHAAQMALIASLLTSEPVTVRNVPSACLDVQWALKLVRQTGKQIIEHGDDLVVHDAGQLCQLIRESAVYGVRGTPQMLAALLGRSNSASVPMPGGCRLGRPIDLHVSILTRMGANVAVDDVALGAHRRGRLRGIDLLLPVTSTGATETCLLAGVAAEGTTVIRGAHLPPPVCDLIELLRAMGGDIEFSGTVVVIRGKETLHGADHTLRNDGIEGLTWAIGTAVSGGEPRFDGFPLMNTPMHSVCWRRLAFEWKATWMC